jgi:hypothetical protein
MAFNLEAAFTIGFVFGTLSYKLYKKCLQSEEKGLVYDKDYEKCLQVLSLSTPKILNELF